MGNERLGLLELVGVACVFIFLSAAGLAAAFFTRLIYNIDGLLLVAICLLMALVFTAMLVAFAQKQGWIGRGKTAEPSSTPAAPAAK